MKSIRHAYLSGREQGFLLVSLLITILLIVLVAVASMQIFVQNHNIALRDTYSLKSQLAADAGADIAADLILADSDWSGTGGEVELSNEIAVRTTYQVTVSTSSDGLAKTLIVTGRSYVPASSSSARTTSKVEVGLKGSGASGVSGGVSVYGGVGGLVMSGTSAVTAGEVFVNGGITMIGTARIGSSGAPVNAQAAHQVCPVGGGSGYPRICNSGENGQPYSLTTTNNIYGQVKGNNQTNGARMSNPGLVSGSVTPSTLPSHNRTGITADITASGQAQAGGTAGCSGVSSKSWPADLKITGNVSLSGLCTITVTGNVWITGTLTLSGSAKLIVQGGLLSPPHIIVDGSSGVALTQTSQLVPNANSTGFRVVTYYSTAACSVTTNCTVTGTDLFNSKGLVTISIGGDVMAAKTQFYARWTAVELLGTADIGSMVGQTTILAGSATVMSGVEVDPSEQGTLSWSVATYKRAY